MQNRRDKAKMGSVPIGFGRRVVCRQALLSGDCGIEHGQAGRTMGEAGRDPVNRAGRAIDIGIDSIGRCDGNRICRNSQFALEPLEPPVLERCRSANASCFGRKANHVGLDFNFCVDNLARGYIHVRGCSRARAGFLQIRHSHIRHTLLRLYRDAHCAPPHLAWGR